jgi:UDP-N-acetylmuramoylalanine--D-glutamate ligase
MTEVRGKSVLVVGLGRSGQAVALCLRRRGALVTVTDIKPPAAFGPLLPELLAQKIGLELGSQRLEAFLTRDLVVVSPGVPWDLPQLEAARARGIPVVPEVEVAGWYLSDPIVGITGSNGKTTTTVLLGKMLEASGFPTFVGGNIGIALSSAVDRVETGSIIIAELSSFQLEAIRDFRPHVAVLLNISPNHLDRHPSFEAYAQAKRQIFRNQRADDYAILNADDPWVLSLGPALASRKVFFSRLQQLPCGVFVSNGNVVYRTGNLERVLFETRDVRLRGGFNLEDVLGAAAAACVLGADFDAVRSAVREFKGVEHRLEYVRNLCGVDFYNNSKATSVDATVKSLEAFEGGVHLILGGKDKGAPYAPLRPLLKDRVREVLLIGAAADRIAQELSGAVELIRAGTLETAVLEAFQSARPGDVVLLAPACSSFDQFQDYEQRGRVFKELAERLARDVESGSVKWKWKLEGEAKTGAPPQVSQEASPEPLPDKAAESGKSIQETASVGLDVSGQFQAESLAGSSEERSEASPETPAETLAPEVEEGLNQVAEAVDGESKRGVTTGSATENRPLEPTLVYEISAQELFPAEIEPAQDYSVEPETSQPQALSTPESTDDVQLPYEARAKQKSPATGGSMGRDFADDASKDESKASERGPTLAEGREPKSSAPDSAGQLRLPGSCPELPGFEGRIGWQAISDLWNAGDERVWRDALSRYWSCIKPENLEVEERMNRLDSEHIKRLSDREWYVFLKDVYFPWKYAAPSRLATTTQQLKKYEETNKLGELFSIKENLFAFDPTDIQQGLKIAKSIKGLGWAGASGLLALLFPKWFGTADQFVVKALREIETLPERQRLDPI